MDVATISLILQYGLRYGPEVIETVRKLLSGKAPTEADWAELRRILDKSGASYFSGAANATHTGATNG